MDNNVKSTPEQEEITAAASAGYRTNEQEAAAEDVPSIEGGAGTLSAKKPKFTKKKMAILGIIVVVVIAVAFAFLHKSKFEKVREECVHIAGMVAGSGDYFTIDTYPDSYENMDDAVVALLLPSTQENALEAIKYANEELGFNGSVYSQMMKTSALMGRQSEENDKYKVSWTYHPDDGLEVTYEKK